MDTETEAAAFGPHAALAQTLLVRVRPGGNDGSHDLSHILRVWRNAWAIAVTEPAADTELLAAAVILHDCVAVEKDSPQRPFASRLAADEARRIMHALDWHMPGRHAPGWPAARLDALAHVIAAHSFSAGIPPETLEARILQDADRLDAIGAVGIARCFYVGGRMGSLLYDPADPQAAARPLDDRRYALDHFGAKLFKVAEGFKTPAGQAMARERTETMRAFVAAFVREVGQSVT